MKHQITSFSHLRVHLQQTDRLKRIALANAVDEHSVEAVLRAVSSGFAEAFLLGDIKKIPVETGHAPSPQQKIHLIDVPDPQQAAVEAVRMVKNGEADVLMKGLINTDVLLRAVLDKEHGILPPTVPFPEMPLPLHDIVGARRTCVQTPAVLSFCAAFEIPARAKLLFLTDPAVIPAPTLAQRVQMLKYLIATARKFGVASPKIALIHATEKPSPKIVFMQDYLDILAMHRQGAFGDVLIEGPLDIFLALDRERGAVKNVPSEIAGDADALMFPDFQSANVFYKALVTFADAQLAGCLVGAEKPVVLTSRGDSADSKFNSIAMACLMAMNN